MHSLFWTCPSELTMRFEWDDNKNQLNRNRHDVGFETASLVFDDPYAITLRDELADEEVRWITVGAIGAGAILLVVHTWFEKDGEDVIRIISARAAESHERKAYEKAHKGTETRDRRDRRKKR
jgi:uncharacterized DUF497 family protein